MGKPQGPDTGRQAQPARELVLASTSPYRRALLERLGISFRVAAPAVDENQLKAKGLRPRLLAEQLAILKARNVAEGKPGATVVGSDQVVELDDCILGKPGSAQAAVEQLIAMAGKTHQIITAIAVVQDDQVFTHTDEARLQMRHLTRQEIMRYVEADRPFDCAGSYKLEARGIALFERIEANDHTAITGLPLVALVTILRGLGYAIP